MILGLENIKYRTVLFIWAGLVWNGRTAICHKWRNIWNIVLDELFLRNQPYIPWMSKALNTDRYQIKFFHPSFSIRLTCYKNFAALNNSSTGARRNLSLSSKKAYNSLFSLLSALCMKNRNNWYQTHTDCSLCSLYYAWLPRRELFSYPGVCGRDYICYQFTFK